MRAAVIGGGLQGVCIALELVDHGVEVDLYERNSSVMEESSAHNEGKIHLGFVYAKDTTLATAAMMIKGALTFQPLIRKWFGHSIDSLPVSSTYNYAVHRSSLISAEEFELHCQRTSSLLEEETSRRPWSYFGKQPEIPPQRLSAREVSSRYGRDSIVAAYRTEEIAVDPAALAALVRSHLTTERRVACLVAHDVRSLADQGDRIDVLSVADGTHHSMSYDFVINAAWTDRLLFDRDMGLSPLGEWSFRLKYYLRARIGSDQRLPSTTFVLGPFGDVVDYGNGTVYLSWYPAGLTAWSFDLSPPRRPSSLAGEQATELTERTLSGLREVLPALDGLKLGHVAVRGGWIFAHGVTDVDNQTSKLHDRHLVGIRGRGRYLSVDTGKLTMAPFFAQAAASVALSQLRPGP